MKIWVILAVLWAPTAQAHDVIPCRDGSFALPCPPPLAYAPFSYDDALARFMAQTGHSALPLLRLPTGHLATELQIDGQRGLFLIDSGASQSVLSAVRAALYPLGPALTRERVTGVPGAQEVTGHRMRHYRIGRITGAGGLIYVADLGFVTRAIAEAGGPEVDGVIGQDLLTRHGAVLDMANNRVFLRPATP